MRNWNWGWIFCKNLRNIAPRHQLKFRLILKRGNFHPQRKIPFQRQRLHNELRKLASNTTPKNITNNMNTKRLNAFGRQFRQLTQQEKVKTQIKCVIWKSIQAIGNCLETYFAKDLSQTISKKILFSKNRNFEIISKI